MRERCDIKGMERDREIEGERERNIKEGIHGDSVK